MKRTLLLLGAVIAALAGALLVGIFALFSFAGVTQETMFLGAASQHAEESMAPADSEAAERQEMAPAAEAAPQVASSSQKLAMAAPVSVASFATDAKVIRNGALTLVVGNPATAVNEVERILAGIPGAFIATAEVRQAGDLQPTSLTLRVPAEAFDQAMAALRALAQEVLAEQTAARDVTEEYTDLDARLRNLQAAETQLLTLVEQADTVDDLLKVEKRLAEVRGEIELLQGRFNVLENRIALATIIVLLHAPPDTSVTLAAQDLPAAHAITTFALTYRNDGSVSARDGILVLRVPELLSMIDVGQGGIYLPLAREIRWNLSDVAAGSVNTVFARMRVESTENDILLQAHIQSASAEANNANNTANLTLSFAPDLTLQVEGPAAGAQGSDLPIWIYFTNAGTGDATDVTVRTTLPPGLTFVRADSGGSFDRDTGTVEWKLGLLQAGASNEVLMHARVDVAEGRLQIPISIAAEQVDAVAFNNRAEMILTALREDVSTRSVWQPGQTVESSIAALIVVAQAAVNVSIWVLVFGIPLVIVGLLGLGMWSGIRRMRRKRGG
ncbi:MAG: DUF4349 domain-containing protein [Chloroflexi bacterium]|nr:DUF4349 domain-containing protein [Chloroflexota bacterium]